MTPKFPYTPDGFNEAKKWLQEIGEWDRVSTTGFSVDGWSVIHAANAIWERIKGELQ